MIVFLPLKDLPAPQQPHDHDDQGDDQKNVDQTSDVKSEISKSPKNDQDDQYRFKHADLLFFSCLCRPVPGRRSQAKCIGMTEAKFLNAFFMPEYFPAVRRPEMAFLWPPTLGFDERAVKTMFFSARNCPAKQHQACLIALFLSLFHFFIMVYPPFCFNSPPESRNR